MAEQQEQIEIEINDAISEFETAQTEFTDSGAYYNAEERDLAVGLATPPALRDLLALVGLPRIYVDAVAERLIPEGFRIGDTSETDEDLWGWYKANSLDNSVRALWIDALVYGRSYITIAAPTETDSENPLLIPDVPIIRVESPLALYAHKDPRTSTIDWAVRVVKNQEGQTEGATLYYPDRTIIYESVEEELVESETIQHALGVVPVVDVTYRSGILDLYGSSLITSEIRSITDAMSRMLMNMQVTSELMATPQRMIFGSSVDEINGENKTGLELYTSSYLVVEDPSASAQQLPAAELRNFTEAITHMMKMAAAYTGLPPQYLSFSNSNPASAEAIRSAETRLVRLCEAVAQQFGDSLERAMRIALLVMGQQLSLEHFQMETLWRDPATPTFAAKADAATKLYANGTGPVPLEQVRIDLGYTAEQRKQMQEWDAQSPLSQVSSLYGSDPTVKEESAESGGIGEADQGDG